MKKIAVVLATSGLLSFGALGLTLPANGQSASPPDEGGHQDQHEVEHMNDGQIPHNLDEMRQMHREHEHRHDFEAMEEMSPEQRDRVIALMREIGLRIPPMNPERGRHVFVEKGCIACHSVNGVGGDLGPALNADDMPRPMNPFEFAARMWRGAEVMTSLQNDIMGEVISLDGQDLADLVAFAHDPREQARLTEDQIPERFRQMIAE